MGLIEPVASPDERPTIVIVDDDEIICELVAEAPISAGYDVEIVNNGADVVDVLWRTPASLVILDCALPGRPGLSVLEDLRESALHESIPIVMLTARRSEWFEAIAMTKGANAYVRKPFDPQSLVVLVTRLLRDRALTGNEIATPDYYSEEQLNRAGFVGGSNS